jgi:hypothetical protein
MAAIISPSDFRLFFTDLDTNWFGRAYSEAPTWNERIASKIPMGGEQMLFGWIGRLDKMREWLGSRVEHAPAPRTYLVVVQNWELTEALDRFKFADDTHGIYYPLIEGMGVSAKKNPDYQLRDLIVKRRRADGDSRQYGPDGLAGVTTNHPVDFYDAAKGVLLQRLPRWRRRSTAITVGGELAPVSYQTAYAEMSSRKSESGEVMGVLPDLVTTVAAAVVHGEDVAASRVPRAEVLSTGSRTTWARWTTSRCVARPTT